MAKPRFNEDWISISEAARRLDVSRRTLRRRIDAANLETRQRQVEGRITRLIRLADLESLEAPPPAALFQPESWQGTVDQALEKAHAAYARIAQRLYQDEPMNLNLAHLRVGPLGKDLSLISQLAQQKDWGHGEVAADRINEVLHLFFAPPLAIEMSIPPTFWESDLGRLISLAKLRTFNEDELMTIAEAAEALQVTRPTIYRWMDEKTLRYVRDDRFQRTLLVRADIEDLLHQVAGHRQAERDQRPGELVSVLGDD